ncbi:uncharacterized protein LOC124497299 [Dermatophagoides farinae]|uniref:uncharacterized protein LOC124497299 n=1 Tax=Dermatophagoides farinae TaxID=6954 RepID=UPI003F5ED2B0
MIDKMSVVDHQSYFRCDDHHHHHHQRRTIMTTTTIGTSTSMPIITTAIKPSQQSSNKYHSHNNKQQLSTITSSSLILPSTPTNSLPISSKTPISTAKSLSLSSSTPPSSLSSSTLIINSLNFIMNTFQCNINQEQAWALIYQSTKTLNELLMQFERRNGTKINGCELLLRKLTSFSQILFDHHGNVCNSTWTVSIDNRAKVMSTTNNNNNNNKNNNAETDEDDDNDILLFTKNDDKRLMNESINGLIASLATIIYSALEWNWKRCQLSSNQQKNNNDDDEEEEEEELDLEESLELLMLSMIRGSEHKDLVDEGYIDAMEESCLNWVLVKCEQHYQTLIQSSEKNATIEMLLTKNQLGADYYYRTVCKMMIDEAVKLSKLVNQFYDHNGPDDQRQQHLNKLFASSDLSPSSYQQLDTESLKIWAQTWIKVMSELRFGVRLRPVPLHDDHVHNDDESKSKEQKLTPKNDELLRHIENIRENLRKAANHNDDESEPSSLRSLPVMFTQESIAEKLKNLKPPSERRNLPKSSKFVQNYEPCLHDRLMTAIHNYDQSQLRPTRTEIKPDVRKLYLLERQQRHTWQRQKHCKSLWNIYGVDNADDNLIEKTSTIKRKMYSPDTCKPISRTSNYSSKAVSRSLTSSIRPALSLSHLIMNDSTMAFHKPKINQYQQQQPLQQVTNKKKRLSLKENNIHHQILIRTSTPKFHNNNVDTKQSSSFDMNNCSTNFEMNNYRNSIHSNGILQSSVLCNSYENLLVTNNTSSNWNDDNNDNDDDFFCKSICHHYPCKNRSSLHIKQTEQLSYIDDDDQQQPPPTPLLDRNPLLRRSFIRKPLPATYAMSKSFHNHHHHHQHPQQQQQLQRSRCSSFSVLPKPSDRLTTNIDCSNYVGDPLSTTTTNSDFLGFRSFMRKSPFRSSLSLVWTKIFGSPKENLQPEESSSDKLKQD